MSVYDNSLTNSDLDAFKNSGEVQTASVTFSGNLGAGLRSTLTSTPLAVTSPDFAQFLFDNSQKHSGKFKNIMLERYTMVRESTSLSELVCELAIISTGTLVSFSASLFNPYAITVALQTTTINFKYIPYEATF